MSVRPGRVHAEPNAAAAVTRVGAQARFEADVLLRNGEQLLVSLVLPLLALIGVVLAHSPSLGPGRRVDVATPGVLALAVVSTAFTGQAIATAYDRRYGALRLLGAGPLGRSGLVAGKAVAVLAVEVVQVVVLGATGLILGWRPHLLGLPIAAVFGLLGSSAFVALALLLAGTLRAEGVLAVANLIWVLLVAGGGLIVPTQRLPGGLREVVRVLPGGALGDGLRAALQHGRVDVAAVVVLVGWAVAGAGLAVRFFRWSD